MEINIKDGYKVTEVGVIPDDWEVKKLGEIVAIRKQKIDPKKVLSQPFCIELEHINQGNGILLGYTETTNKSSMKNVFYKNDILFGKLRAYLRKYWFASTNGVCSTEIWPFVVIPDILLPKYVYFCIQTDNFIETASMAYGTHMPRTDWNVIKNYYIPLPPLAEQKAIAHALSDVDNLITAIDQLITKKRNLKQGTMQELLTGKKRLPGFSGKWEVKTFRECFDFLSTGNNSRSDLSEYGNVGYIHYGDIHTQWNLVLDCDKDNIPLINKEKVKGLPTLKDGDLIIADASEDYEGLGVSIEIKNIQDKEIVAGLHTLLLRADKQVIADGFKAFITSMQYVKQSFQKIATGISVYGISKTNLKNVEILLPPTIEEQKAIAEILTDMDKEIEALEKKRDKYKTIKQGMMQELLTGKTRIIDN